MPETNSRQIGRVWEEKTKEFLENYGFEKINGGDSFCPGNPRNQIDVVACKENVVFIIECKTSEELGNGSLRSEINKFITKARRAKEALKRGYSNNEYTEYRDFRFVFATKNIEWNCEDLVGTSGDHVYKWDNQFFDYYNLLLDCLGARASTPQLLGELKVFKRNPGELTIPAIKITTNKITTYNFITSPEQILDMCCVARREFKKTEYYQRMIDGNRLNKIIQYLDDNKTPPFEDGRTIPGNIIMCTHKGRNESPLKWESLNIAFEDLPGNIEIGALTIEKRYRSLWIIDGQHRFFSFFKPQNRTEKEHDRILVSVMEGLNIGQEREIFLDVNQKQVKVPAEYIIDMYGEINPNELKGKISRTIKHINLIEKINFSQGRSAPNFFYHKIKIPSHGAIIGRTKKPYNIVSFFNGLKKFDLLENTTCSTLSGNRNNPFFNNRSETFVKHLAKGICDFFAVLEGSIKETVFFEKLSSGRDSKGHLYILLGIFERIISAYVKKKGVRKPGLGDYKKYILILKKYVDSISPSSYSEIINTSGDKNRDKTVKRIVLGMKELGAQGFEEFNDLDPGINELKITLIDFEKDMRDFLNTKIKNIEGWENWCTGERPDILPDKILEASLNETLLRRKINNLTSRGIDWDPKNNYVGMTLSQTFDLMKKRNIWPIIEPIMCREFTDKESFETSFKNLRDIRNKLIHGNGPDTLVTPENLDICESQIKQFYKCIRQEGWEPEPEEFEEENEELEDPINEETE